MHRYAEDRVTSAGPVEVRGMKKRCNMGNVVLNINELVASKTSSA
jgi:hypothetical protein